MKKSAGRKRIAREVLESRGQRTISLIVGDMTPKRYANVARESAAARRARLDAPTNRHKMTPKALEKADAQRIITPLVVKLRPGTVFAVIQPEKFGEINIDEDYQRMVIKALVNTLIYVLRNGGDIPAPVHLARRKDGSLWILDGQQRFWAHLETGTPLKAWIHPVENIEDERDLYNILNRKVQQNAMNQVKSSNSLVAACVRGWDDSDQSPMHRRINFGSNSGRPYDCTLLVRGVAAALTGLKVQGKISNVMDRTEVEWNRNVGWSEKVGDAFLELVSLIWPGPYRVRYLTCLALGSVCHRRWRGGTITLPSRKEIAALRRVNWENVSQSKALKYLSVYENAITRIWKSDEVL